MPKALFLRSIDGNLITRYSDIHNLGRRAGQLRRFVLDLQQILGENIELYELKFVPVPLELWVLSRKDWANLTSRPYGLAFLRQQAVIAPADYNPRLTERFDELLLLAGQHNLKAPGEVRELFDVLIGFEWMKGNLKSLGLQSRLSQNNASCAAQLLLLVLQSEKDLLQRVLDWAKILALSELKGPFKELAVIGEAMGGLGEVSWEGLKARQSANSHWF
jgi:hypothetical protein